MSQPNLCSWKETEMVDHDDEEIVRLVTAGSPQEAHLWRQALEAEGIRCRVVGEYLGSLGVYPGHFAVPELWVHRGDVERARVVLDGLQKHRPR
jgi:hypothetical protein